MERDTGLIAEIRAQKLREMSEDRDALLEFASIHLYGEKIHYVLELIQNAEDEGAKSVTFIFDHNYAVVTNDGRPFNTEDVWGICSVRPGRKKNKIGFFGIGFKSVFKITDRPQIISNGYNFAIEHKIYPYPGEPLPDVLADYHYPDKGSVFILPYSDVVLDPSELIEQFNTLDEKLLLFLDCVEHIRFIDRVNDTSWEITKQRVGQDTYHITHPGKATSGPWRVFHRLLPVDVGQVAIPSSKIGIEQTRLTVAFPCDTEIPEVTVANVVYCYLPTKKRTDLPFLIQADFLPTVNRENIADDLWNKWLLGQLGIFAADCIEKLRTSELGDVLFDLIPLRREIQDPQIQILYSQLRSQLTDKKFVQTQRRRFIAPSVAAFPRDERVRRLLNEETLWGVIKGKRSYVKPPLDERAKEVLEELDAFPVDEAEVIAFIQKEIELKRKDAAWFLDLYDFLGSYFGDTKRPYLWNDRQREHFEIFSRCRCILTAQNHLVAPKDPEHLDRMMCYSGIANLAELGDLFTDEELVILHPFFQEASVTGRKGASSDIEEKRERVKEFFDTLDIRKYFRQFHVINQIILPKFRSGKYLIYNKEMLYRYLDYIRINLDAYESEAKKSRPTARSSEEVFGNIISSVLIQGFILKRGRRVEAYRAPRELYFSRAYGKAELMEELFKGVKDIAFLSPYYINRGKRDVSKVMKKGGKRKPAISWRKFFELLGVWSCPRIVGLSSSVSISGKQGYDWVSKQYSPRGEHELVGDNESPDIRRLLDYLSKRRSPQASRRRLTLLWSILEKNWSRVYKSGCKCTYRYFYRDWNSILLSTSSFLEMLRRWEWVPTSSDGFTRPGEVHLDKAANRHLLGDDGIYTRLNGNKTFLDDLKVRAEPDPADVVSHLTSLSQYNGGKKNRLGECHTIYSFLRDHPTEELEVGHLSELFETGNLLYLPRADRSWWPPSIVFWQDFSRLFGSKRGYIEQNAEQFYPNSLRDFMLSLGVHERPSTLDCLGFLHDLKNNAEPATFRRFAPSLYLHLELISSAEDNSNGTWSEPLFLSQKDEFLYPAELYIPDEDDYVSLLGAQLDILWLPFLPMSIPNFLRRAGFISLADHTQVSKDIDGAEELDSGVVQSLMNILTATVAYLKAAHPKHYEALRDSGAFEISRSLSIFQATSIRLHYTVRHLRTGEDVSVQTQSGVFLSRTDNSLWVTRGLELFSTEVARQLSRLFRGAESEAFSFLDSMMQTRGDPDAVSLKLLAYGIDSEVSDEDKQVVEAIEILPSEDASNPSEPESPKDSGQTESKKPEQKDAPAPPPDIKVSSWLIKPDEYGEDE